MNYYLDVFKKYADFSGRARRSEYWFFLLFNSIAYILLTIIDAFIGMPILSMLYWLAALIPSLAVSVRRLHDTGRGGITLLLSLIPVVGFIILLIFFVTDSNPGVNKFGPSPKAMPA